MTVDSESPMESVDLSDDNFSTVDDECHYEMQLAEGNDQKEEKAKLFLTTATL